MTQASNVERGLNRAGPRAASINPLVRAASRLWFRACRPLFRRRLKRPTLYDVDGLSLLVFPGVLDPVLFRSGKLLATALGAASELTPPSASATPRALDMGTGSGIGALYAARRGYDVVAVDVNPEAVRCARINAMVNRLDDRIDVREGDLFEPVPDVRFDLVAFNPPFFRGAPGSDYDAGWRSEDVIERFAAGLTRVLAPEGKVAVLLSTDGPEGDSLEHFHAHGLDLSPLVRRHFGNEIMTVYVGSARRAGEVE